MRSRSDVSSRVIVNTMSKNNPKKANSVAQDMFIQEYFSNGGRKKAAADKLEIGWSTVKNWFQNDEDFRNRVDEFRDVWRDNLRAVAFKRASEKSDNLLMFLLKSLEPETYDDNLRAIKWRQQQGMGGADGLTPLRVTLVTEPEPWAEKDKEPLGDSEPTKH